MATAKKSALTISRKEYAKRIKAALGKSVVGFIEAGQELQRAQDDDVAHGEWEAFVKKEVGISPRMAHMLMKIAKHPVISNQKHVSDLPPSWGTLYQLTKVPRPRLEAKLKDGTVNANMERKEVAELLPKIRSAKKKVYDRSVDDPEEQADDVDVDVNVTDDEPDAKTIDDPEEQSDNDDDDTVDEPATLAANINKIKTNLSLALDDARVVLDYFGPVDDEIVAACDRVAEAWSKAACNIRASRGTRLH